MYISIAFSPNGIPMFGSVVHTGFLRIDLECPAEVSLSAVFRSFLFKIAHIYVFMKFLLVIHIPVSTFI